MARTLRKGRIRVTKLTIPGSPDIEAVARILQMLSRNDSKIDTESALLSKKFEVVRIELIYGSGTGYGEQAQGIKGCV